MRTFAAVLGLLASSAAPALAQNGAHCARETFDIQGKTVAVTACPGTADAHSVPVTETIKSGANSLTHNTEIQLLPGAGVSRGIDDISLTSLGVPGTLHLTLAYRDGSVLIEHALLLPGATPLK
jgi:hypothetical protein